MASPVLSPNPIPGGDETKKRATNGKRKSVVNEGFDVNLVPSELRPVFGAPRKSFLHNAVVSVSWAVGLSAVLYGGIWAYGYYLKTNTLLPIMTEETSVNADIASLEAQRTEFLAFQSKINNAKTLLDKHQYWSQFLSALEQATISDVSYINVIGSQDGNVTLAGFAKDYRAVGRQLLAFQSAKDVVASASISSANAVLNPNGEVSGVNFTVSLKIQPSVLKLKAGAVPQVVVPTTSAPQPHQ